MYIHIHVYTYIYIYIEREIYIHTYVLLLRETNRRSRPGLRKQTITNRAKLLLQTNNKETMIVEKPRYEKLTS